jgi:hypothetical protein
LRAEFPQFYKSNTTARRWLVENLRKALRNAAIPIANGPHRK